MRLLRLPLKPEPVVEEGYEMRGGLFGVLTGTAEFVKFRRELPYPPIQRDRTIIVHFEKLDRKLVGWVESTLEIDREEMYMYGHRLYRKMDILLDGFLFHGVFPIQKLETEGDWLLSIDHYEEVMSHRQHYRYKHFPAGLQRFEFTTTSDFLRRIQYPEVQHVIVDSHTAQCLSYEFETYQKEAVVPPVQYRQVGLILEIMGRLIFSDMALDRNMQWVNENPGSDSARPQFIVVQSDQLQPFTYNR